MRLPSCLSVSVTTLLIPIIVLCASGCKKKNQDAGDMVRIKADIMLVGFYYPQSKWPNYSEYTRAFERGDTFILNIKKKNMGIPMGYLKKPFDTTFLVNMNKGDSFILIAENLKDSIWFNGTYEHNIFSHGTGDLLMGFVK